MSDASILEFDGCIMVLEYTILSKVKGGNMFEIQSTKLSI